MSVNTNPVIGVVIIARHGDRQGFYQSPATYTATATSVTPLGLAQEFQLGQQLKSIYANPNSPNTILGFNGNQVVASQISSTVDGGGEGGVIFESAEALWDGFYPPSPEVETIALANGTNITSPLGGAQFVQINTALPAYEINLEGFTNCNTWATNTAAFYQTPDFLAVQNSAQPLFAILTGSGLVGNRPVSLSNIWNIYDFMNVQSIHNATYNNLLLATGPTILSQVRALANYREYGSFSSPTLGGIGNIAGQVFLPLIIESLQGFTNQAVNPVKLAHFQIAYKPFISFFNMTNIAAAPTFEFPQGIVNYASVMTLELRNSMTGTGYDVRFKFKNGTTDQTAPLTSYPLFGSNSVDTDLNTFISNLEPYAINNITTWCNKCNNTINTGCDIVNLAAIEKAQLTAANATIASFSTSKVSGVGAGFIGAAITIVLGAVLIGLGMGLGWIKFGTKFKGNNGSNGGGDEWNDRDNSRKRGDGIVLGDSSSFASSNRN